MDNMIHNPVPKAKVTVKRDRQYFAFDMPVHVYVDGEERAKLLSDQSTTIEVPKGSHTILLKSNVRNKTISVDISKNTTYMVRFNRFFGNLTVEKK